MHEVLLFHTNALKYYGKTIKYRNLRAQSI